MIWTIIEPGLGIIAASIVTLRPLLRTLRIFGFNDNTYTLSGNTLSIGSRGMPLNSVPTPENNEHQLDVLAASSGDPRGRSSVIGRMEGGARILGNNRSDGGVAVKGYATENGSQEFILAPSLSFASPITDTPREMESDADVDLDIDLEGQVVDVGQKDTGEPRRELRGGE
jgi:hypothetical protein